jgi:hypothetical protein
VKATDRPWSHLKLYRGQPALIEWLALHGYAAGDVRRARIEDNEVILDILDRDQHGKPYAAQGANEAATHEERTPLVAPWIPSEHGLVDTWQHRMVRPEAECNASWRDERIGGEERFCSLPEQHDGPHREIEEWTDDAPHAWPHQPKVVTERH